MTSRPIQIGDIARIREGDNFTDYAITEIKDGKLYATSPDDGENILLISTPEGWQVDGWTVHHTVEFFPGPSLPQISDIHYRIFAELSDQELLRICQTDKYFQELCEDENFWHLRILHKFGSSIVTQKPSNITYRHQYKNLVTASTGKFSSYLKHDRYDILDYLSRSFDPENLQILIKMILVEGTIGNIHWLLNNENIKLDPKSLQLQYAVKAKNYPVIKYIVEHYPRYPLKFYEINSLGHASRFDILDILFQNGNLDVYTLLNSALRWGNTEVLDWLNEKGVKIDTLPDVVIPKSLDWIAAHNYELTDEVIEKITHNAILLEKVNILQWFHERNLLPPYIDLSYILRIPDRYREKIINWLVNQGAPIDQNIVNLAITRGNLPAIKIFSRHGIPLGKNEALLALDKNHPQITRYILLQML